MRLAGRIFVSMIIATCALRPQAVSAQGVARVPGSQAQPEATRNLEGQPAGDPAADEVILRGPTMWGRLGQRIIDGPEPPGGYPITPFPTHPNFQPNFPRPRTPYYGPDNTVTTWSTDEDYWDDEGPLERILTTMTRNTWFHTEYLLWDIERPGAQQLGAPLGNVLVPTNPFPVFDNQIPPQQIGVAEVTDLDGVSLDDTNGIRATMGIPLVFGSLEISTFLLEQSTDKVLADVGPGQFAATSVFVNGGLASVNNVFLYDQFFQARFSSDIWGAQAKVFYDPYGNDEGARVRPFAGFQMINIKEQLLQIGGQSDLQNGGVLISTINSRTTNNIYGPTLGLRASLEHRWFTVMIEPHLLFGLNSYKASVATERLRQANDPPTKDTDRETKLTLAAEIVATGMIHVSENFSVTVSGTFMWASTVTRPHENIFYNDNGINNPPAFAVNPHRDDLTVWGISVGGVYYIR